MELCRFKMDLFLSRSTRVVSIIALLSFVILPAQSQQPLTPNKDALGQGIRLYESGNLDGAIKALRQLVKLDKADGKAWYHLGVALYRANKNKDARKALETAAQLMPNDEAVHTLLAFTYTRINKNSEAHREANRALALNERNAGAHYVLGVVSMRIGEFDQAKISADKALRIEPNFSLAMILKSQALVGHAFVRFDGSCRETDQCHRTG